MRAAARHVPGEMNKTEANYALILEAKKRAGEIRDWRFEPLRFVLARKTTYCPDFMVIDREGLVEFVDVKHMRRDSGGTYRIHQEDDASAKLKVAAALFPWFLFVVVAPRPRGAGGGWVRREIRP